MTCETSNRSGERCKNKARFLVNGKISEVQSAVCGVHLPGMVKELETYTNPVVKRRHPDDKYASTVYVLRRV